MRVGEARDEEDRVEGESKGSSEVFLPIKLHAGLGAVDELCSGEVVGELAQVLHPAVVALYISWVCNTLALWLKCTP